MATPLKLECERRGISSVALARAVGVRQPTINRIANGKKRASADLAAKIASYLGNAVTRDQILFPEDYPVTLPPRKQPRIPLAKAS